MCLCIMASVVIPCEKYVHYMQSTDHIPRSAPCSTYVSLIRPPSPGGMAKHSAVRVHKSVRVKYSIHTVHSIATHIPVALINANAIAGYL